MAFPDENVTFSFGTPITTALNGFQYFETAEVALQRAMLEELKALNQNLTNPAIQKYFEDHFDPESKQVFIVHGHDDMLTDSVKELLSGVGLYPVILHEQANEGLTIIEKFEKHADAAAFAVVLLTADDLGKCKSEENLRMRARQNVILELGYFMGLIGRDYVCAIYESGVELPSDMHGVLYIPFDPDGKWKTTFIKEMNSAKVNLDQNALVAMLK